MVEEDFSDEGGHSGLCDGLMSEATTQVGDEFTCPMTAMCKGFAVKPVSGAVFVVPGLLFIFIGLAILLQPSLLVWLAGCTTVLLGLLALAGGFAIRRFTAQIEGDGNEGEQT